MRATALGSLVQSTWVAHLAALAFLWFYALERFQGRDAAVMPPVLAAAGIAIAAMLLYLFFNHRHFYRGYRKHNHLVGAPCKLTIEELWLRHISPNWEAYTMWSGFIAVDEADGILLLLLDNVYFYPVPSSAFESKEEKNAFVAHVRDKIRTPTRGQDTEATTFTPPVSQIATASPAAAPEIASRIRSALLQNTANAFRLAFFREIAVDRVSVAWWQVAAFGLATLLVPALYDIASIGMNGQIEWEAIPSATAHLPIVLFAAIVTAYVLGRGEKTLLFFQTFLMIAVAIDLVVYAAGAAAALYPEPWP